LQDRKAAVSCSGFERAGVTRQHITEASTTCRQIGMPEHQEMAEALLSKLWALAGRPLTDNEEYMKTPCTAKLQRGGALACEPT
jgi:hypothetical protein